MVNMITGGYGDSISSKYSEIDWTKCKHVVSFNVFNINDVTFKIDYNVLNFDIKKQNCEFMIDTHDKNFDIKTFNINFNAY